MISLAYEAGVAAPHVRLKCLYLEKGTKRWFASGFLDLNTYTTKISAADKIVFLFQGNFSF